MAPLFGMADHHLARLPGITRRTVVDLRARSRLQFQGLRGFQRKSSREWEPRYLAANGGQRIQRRQDVNRHCSPDQWLT